MGILDKLRIRQNNFRLKRINHQIEWLNLLISQKCDLDNIELEIKEKGINNLAAGTQTKEDHIEEDEIIGDIKKKREGFKLEIERVQSNIRESFLDYLIHAKFKDY